MLLYLAVMCLTLHNVGIEPKCSRYSAASWCGSGRGHKDNQRITTICSSKRLVEVHTSLRPAPQTIQSHLPRGPHRADHVCPDARGLAEISMTRTSRWSISGEDIQTIRVILRGIIIDLEKTNVWKLEVVKWVSAARLD